MLTKYHGHERQRNTGALSWGGGQTEDMTTETTVESENDRDQLVIGKAKQNAGLRSYSLPGYHHCIKGKPG